MLATISRSAHRSYAVSSFPKSVYRHGMLTILGDRSNQVRCDGIARRSFLKVGTFAGIGSSFSLADLLRAEAIAGVGSSHKAIINIHLDGGPSQMDLIDPKLDAPSDLRSPFGSVRTNLPGVHLTELMPKVASIADKFVFLRSLVGSAARHDAFQCQSGFAERDLQGIGGRPAMGCIVNKMLGKPDDPIPAFVDILQGRGKVRNSARPGFLGPVHQPFRPDISKFFHRELEASMKGELKRLGAKGQGTQLGLTEGLTMGRLEDRSALLSNLDTLKRKLDRGGGQIAAMDEFNQQAMNILTSGRLAEAMDLEKEDPKVLAKYTPKMRETELAQVTSEGPMAARKMLMARRLVEAGARVVSVSISDFDTHRNNNARMQQLGPILDHALWALVTDLDERGMLDDVTIVAWGEFGRTPKFNANGGRDHWPKLSMGMMAGGGMNVGQVIGASDRSAAEPTERPVHFQDVFATLYHNLGIDPKSAQLIDPSGRPQYLVGEGEVIRELV